MQTSRGTSARAVTLPRTFLRRSSSASPRWRRSGRVRTSTSSTSRRHADAISRASARAGTSPRSHARSGSPGTGTRASTESGATTSTTIAAASRASRRRPCSFHARTNVRAFASYTIAERPLTKARRLPAHSAQRRTGHGPGEPQRSQTGGPSRIREAAHVTQSARPGASQIAHRSGNRRSSSRTVRRYGRTRHVFVSDRRRDELAEVVLRPLEVGGRLDRREATA